MKNIEIVTFKGCRTALELEREMEDQISDLNLDASVQFVVVPSEDAAKEHGLAGSPTVRIDGSEVLQGTRGPEKFY